MAKIVKRVVVIEMDTEYAVPMPGQYSVIATGKTIGYAMQAYQADQTNPATKE